MAQVQTVSGGGSYDPYEQRRSSIRNYYQTYLGRDPVSSGEDMEGYTGWVGGQYSLPDVENYIKNSPEAQQYRTRQTQPVTESGHGGGGIFSDPATQRWESATNDAAARLQKPQNNPDFQPYIDYMRKYFAQLQQPGYTPAEQELMQTQALDPMERQRTAAREQVTQRMARQGVQGGLVERALQDVDRQFNEQRTRTQAGFANNQIAYDKQRQAQAAQVGSAISQAQQAMATNDEQRMLQALTLLFSVPQYADQRLSLANQTLQPMNPGNLLGILSSLNANNAGANQYSNAMNQQYWNQLGALFGSFF